MCLTHARVCEEKEHTTPNVIHWKMFVSIDMKSCQPLVTPLRTAGPNQPCGRIRTVLFGVYRTVDLGQQYDTVPHIGGIFSSIQQCTLNGLPALRKRYAQRRKKKWWINWKFRFTILFRQAGWIFSFKWWERRNLSKSFEFSVSNDWKFIWNGKSFG